MSLENRNPWRSVIQREKRVQNSTLYLSCGNLGRTSCHLGGSLKELCQTLVNSFVSVRILVDWAAQIASAMKCLTSVNLMHRDLKADNGSFFADSFHINFMNSGWFPHYYSLRLFIYLFIRIVRNRLHEYMITMDFFLYKTSYCEEYNVIGSY